MRQTFAQPEKSKLSRLASAVYCLLGRKLIQLLRSATRLESKRVLAFQIIWRDLGRPTRVANCHCESNATASKLVVGARNRLSCLFAFYCLQARQQQRQQTTTLLSSACAADRARFMGVSAICLPNSGCSRGGAFESLLSGSKKVIEKRIRVVVVENSLATTTRTTSGRLFNKLLASPKLHSSNSQRRDTHAAARSSLLLAPPAGLLGAALRRLPAWLCSEPTPLGKQLSRAAPSRCLPIPRLKSHHLRKTF